MSRHPVIRQQGTVLFVSLVFLLILSTLGITAMNGSIVEERMAGNSRDINMAFQAADSALRSGEQYIANTGNNVSTRIAGVARGSCGTGTNKGLCSLPLTYTNPVTPAWSSVNWSSSSAVLSFNDGASVLDSQFLVQPSFIIEGGPGMQALSRAAGSSIVIGSSPSMQVYRITARGLGVAGTTDSAVVMLQSIFRN